MSPLDRVYHLEVREAKSVNDDRAAERANRYVAAKEKKRWEGLWLQQLMIVRADPFMSFAKANVAIYFPRRNHRDEENYRHPVVKPLADALQKGGYLRDDTAEWFAVGSFELLEGKETWPDDMSPLVKALTVVNLEATYE